MAISLSGDNGITFPNSSSQTQSATSYGYQTSSQVSSAITTALATAFTASLTPTGFQKLSSGLIIQWLPAGSGVRSWAIPFPTAVFGAWYTATGPGSSTDNPYVTTLTTTQVGFSQTGSTPSGYIIGIGY